MSKIAVIAKLPLKPGTRDDFVDAFRTMFPVVAEEEGTVAYVLHLDQKDENLAWVYELYADDAALAAHGSSDGMKEGMAAFGPYLAEGVELHRLRPIEAKGLEV